MLYSIYLFDSFINCCSEAFPPSHIDKLGNISFLHNPRARLIIFENLEQIISRKHLNR